MLKLSLLWTGCLFLFPFLLVQGIFTRRGAIKLPEAPGPREGGEPGDLIVVVGDSVVAGVGVETTGHALPAKLCDALNQTEGQTSERTFRWRAIGRNGDRLQDVLEVLPKLAFLDQKPSLLLVNVGVNDVSKLTSMTRWQLQLTTLVTDVKQKLGVPLVLLGLPPMHAFPLLPQPLRFALGVRAKMLDRSLERIAEILPDVYFLKTDLSFEPEYMAVDGYHPSAKAIDVWTKDLANQIHRLDIL